MSYTGWTPSSDLQTRIDDFKARISMTKDTETGLWRLQFTYVDPAKSIDRQAESHPKTGYCMPVKVINFRRDVLRLWRDYLTPGPARDAFEEVHAEANRTFVKRTKRRTTPFNAIDLEVGRHRASV